MIVVLASFRLPQVALARGRTLIPAVIAATRTEDGCHLYHMGEDVLEPGLFRVSELWESTAHLTAHFTTPHMAAWNKVRAEMGMTERQIRVFGIEGEIKV